MFKQLCNDLVGKITDYRVGEIPVPDAAHVERWISQFDENKRIPILHEMIHILSKVYLSRSTVMGFLQMIVQNSRLVGTDIANFWNNVYVLDIQQGGTSQSTMKSLLSSVLQQYGVNLYNTNSNNGIYIYLDDVCFSGNRIKNDITIWLSQGRSLTINKIMIITMANHSNGKWWAEKGINEKMQQLGLNFKIEWWTCYKLNNALSHPNESDLFMPMTLPTDPYVSEYVEYLKSVGYPPEKNLRKSLPNQPSPTIFSSEASRNFIEQEFLIKGSYIRHICKMLPEAIRPLGFSLMKTLGFGSPVVSFNNCPNTAPLALWAGDPWYPLFPRRAN